MRELTLHNITKVTRRPLNYYPAGRVPDVPGAYCCQNIDIESDDGAVFTLILFANDPAALAPLGVVWNPPVADIGTSLPPSDTPTTDRVAIVPELAEAML